MNICTWDTGVLAIFVYYQHKLSFLLCSVSKWLIFIIPSSCKLVLVFLLFFYWSHLHFLYLYQQVIFSNEVKLICLSSDIQRIQLIIFYIMFSFAFICLLDNHAVIIRSMFYLAYCKWYFNISHKIMATFQQSNYPKSLEK